MTDRVPVATEISLETWLAAKEERAARQIAWLTGYQQAVISLTLVTPGAVKDTAAYRDVMRVAVQQCDQLLREHQWSVRDSKILWLPTGPEAMWCVAHPARAIKACCVALEESHPLGRLWDLDVISPHDGPVSRQMLGQAGRRCLVCDELAHVCSRSRRHPQEQVMGCVEKIINDWFSGN